MIQGTSSLTWSDDADPEWQVGEILLPDTAYFSSDGQLWEEVPTGVITPTGELADPLRQLTQARDIALEGTESLDGTPVQRYAMTLPTDPVGFGFTESERRGVTDPLSVSALVWIDSQGRIVRVLRTLTTSAGAIATTDARLSDFAEPVDIQAPSSPHGR